jgi:hypothetical protein
LYNLNSQPAYCSLKQIKIQDTGYKIQDTGYKIQDTGYKIQDTRFRIQDTRFRIQDTGYRMLGMPDIPQYTHVGVQKHPASLRGVGSTSRRPETRIQDQSILAMAKFKYSILCNYGIITINHSDFL